MDEIKARIRKLGAVAEWILGRRAARAIGVLALFAVGVSLLLALLNWYVVPTKPSERKDLVLALAQILGGTALLAGIYFTWRTLQVNREGQITERFTRAIDQLGATDAKGQKPLEIRLGGIYALERIARESEKDYWTIMEVLTAYVRQHARLRPEEIEEIYNASAQDGMDAISLEPDPDIQAIMTVLGRRAPPLGHREPEPLDLRNTKLTGADLKGAHLAGALLEGAALLATNLEEADLRRAHLHDAHLSGATLTSTDLRSAYLTRAKLIGAKFIGAKLEDAYFGEADLRGAKLWTSKWEGADFTGADLREAQFMATHLRGVILKEADLKGARFMFGMNFDGTDLTQAQLEQTTGFGSMRFPDGLKPPTHWNVELEQTEGD